MAFRGLVEVLSSSFSLSYLVSRSIFEDLKPGLISCVAEKCACGLL